MRTPLIAGNWKMYKTLADARALVQGIRDGLQGCFGQGHRAVEVLICPPTYLLFPMAKAVAGSGIKLGAQNVHHEGQGAFTGETSVLMLKDAGCSHVIIGHSERRQLFGETGPGLAKKVRAAVAGGLSPIYCVGETLEQREKGETLAVVGGQLREVLEKDVNPAHLIVAYEPVWAIGTGKTATPQQAQEVHEQVRSTLSAIYDRNTAGAIRLLYGGSVKTGNAADLLAQPDIDGALVGGACLAAGDFLAIITAAAITGAATE